MDKGTQAGLAAFNVKRADLGQTPLIWATAKGPLNPPAKGRHNVNQAHAVDYVLHGLTAPD